jgi:hypothetical protein
VTVPDVRAMSLLVHTAIKSWDASRDRSVQARSGRIGFSSLGFCRQQALLTMQGVADTDPNNVWPAVLGTLVGAGAETALKRARPDWLIQRPITATFANGASLKGTADIVDPPANVVWDVKTKDGFGWVKREPWTRNYDFQTWGYVHGALQMGLLDKTRPAYQGLIYLDRSGGEERPYVVVKEWLPTLEDEIVSWIDDVIYANVHHEDAERDIPAPVCERICAKFTACRGSLPDSGSGGVYDDPHLVDAANAYRQAVADEKEAKELKEAARAELAGVDGIVGGWQVRWTSVGESRIPETFRRGYMKIDVREARKR